MVSEIILFCAVYMYRGVFIVVIILMVFLGGLYNLIMFVSTQHGDVINYINSNCVNNSSEYLLLFLHFYPMLFFILNVSYLNKFFLF